ncbi:MAG TPA: hypothetical protein VH372_01285, partial [Actinospica sp.]|nr:hypothetical protein [Actinospica sp.]
APTSSTAAPPRYPSAWPRRAGHVGDPDSANGYIIDAYQNSSSSAGKKMFLVTTPSGATYQYMHTLVAGELHNNSFDAISPDSQFMVAGEWGTMDHLQIYPTPLLDATTPATGGSLDLSGYRTRPPGQRHPGLRLRHLGEVDLRLG